MSLALAAALLAAAPVAFDPAPWLADLEAARTAVDAKYANRDWLVNERGVDLDAAFARARARIAAAGSDAEARQAFDRLIQRFRDGHVGIEWPSPPVRSRRPRKAPAPPLCARLGYDAAYVRPATVAALPGYARCPAPVLFEAGLVTAGGRRIGMLRIGLFMPQGYPDFCADAATALGLQPASDCDPGCADRVLTHAYARMTDALMARITELKTAGADVLLVDLTGNGGGSEWAEAAARTLTARRLVSARRAYMRGPHWAAIWRSFERDFRSGARAARGAERTQLIRWAEQAGAAALEAERDCSDGNCPRLAVAGYATGIVGAAAPGEYRGKAWADTAFSITQHAYREGVWDGPLLLLVDQETWSAAEQVAAVLQDNDAAVVIGARTGGAGCGHVNGGTPTTLPNSRAILKLPDCARLRRDGSNEVDGIVPDVPIALRHDDGHALKVRLIAAALPGAIARAESQRRAR